MPEIKVNEGAISRDSCTVDRLIGKIAHLHTPKNYFMLQYGGPYTQKFHPGSILTDPHFNKATAFTEKERDRLHLRGLLPPAIETIETQVQRAYKQLMRFTVPMSQHIYLSSLRERNVTLFYKLVMSHLEEVMPLIYTPVVGQACLEYGLQYRASEGMYISIQDKGRVKSILSNWKPNVLNHVAMIVVTDGSRILGLGDLGACGMGIPIGKLALYIAAGGFHPSTTLPILIDVGTNNEELLKDNFYLGLKQNRVSDKEYYELFDEFMESVHEQWPQAVIQFEDVSNNHCFDLLEKYRYKYTCFNDDIQGTGAVIAAGFLNALKAAKLHPSECPVLFLGAGSAAVGVAQQIIRVFQARFNLGVRECTDMFYVVDSKGLLTQDRPGDIQEFKKPFCRADHRYEEVAGLSVLDLVKKLKPKALIGLSGQPAVFTKEALEFMAGYADKPIVFPLSNPTSKAECTFEEAIRATNGRVIFASGSPFEPVTYNDKVYKASQGNNLYAFPGLGMAAWLGQARQISDNMVTKATIALADYVSDSELEQNQLYPPLSDSRELAAHIAAKVMEAAYHEGLSDLVTQPANYLEYVQSVHYRPEYLEDTSY